MTPMSDFEPTKPMLDMMRGPFSVEHIRPAHQILAIAGSLVAEGYLHVSETGYPHNPDAQSTTSHFSPKDKAKLYLENFDEDSVDIAEALKLET